MGVDSNDTHFTDQLIFWMQLNEQAINFLSDELMKSTLHLTTEKYQKKENRPWGSVTWYLP